MYVRMCVIFFGEDYKYLDGHSHVIKIQTNELSEQHVRHALHGIYRERVECM